ncbi:radical SAM protein [bacterium]|nr:radical SAM protein [bacterium]
MIEKYPSILTPESKVFNPLDAASQTEKIVSDGSSRKYTDFYWAGVYGGISTGYTIGCCLKCVFCWVNWSRDFPFRMGKYFSPQQTASNLLNNARKRGSKKIRISGGEPTLCPEHLLSVLDLIKIPGYLFILETNGILLGKDEEYIEKLKKYKNMHIRVSIKAGTPEGFEKRTGAKGDYYELPFKTVEYLKYSGISFHVAAMTDPRLMTTDEREKMTKRLKLVGYRDYLEEEICDPYKTAVKRLEYAGFKLWR